MRRKRLNARLRRLVRPKPPSMIFAELFKDVPVLVAERKQSHFTVFVASIEVKQIRYNIIRKPDGRCFGRQG